MKNVMRVLVLGGTGSIGAPIVDELVRHGHEVMALVRSEASARKVADLGALPIPGDIAIPDGWLPVLPPIDGLIQVAATFDDSEELIDRRLMDALLPYLNAVPRTVRFLYTGGCWLFGPTDGSVTTEESPFSPLPVFAWSAAHIGRVLDAPGIEPIVIHPGMVYEPSGGVFHRFYRDAIDRTAVRVVVSETIRWPLVHSNDLATLYRLALEHGVPRESYIGVAIEGLEVGRIARAFATRLGTRQSEPEVISEDRAVADFGIWANGYALDQVQSGDKARRCLAWNPTHTDPLREIANLTDPSIRTSSRL